MIGNFNDDIRVLLEVQHRWESFLSKKGHKLPCGFNHNVLGLLGELAFMAVMNAEAKEMEVNP